MKFKLLLLVVCFIPALVMAQAKPATSLPIEKPIAVNPPANTYHPQAEAAKAWVTAKVQAGDYPVEINPLPDHLEHPNKLKLGSFRHCIPVPLLTLSALVALPPQNFSKKQPLYRQLKNQLR